MDKSKYWARYKKHLCVTESIGMTLDISRMSFDEGFFDSMAKPMTAALAAMDEIEGGAIANIDEQRMVGHYWLRAPESAPDPEITQEIQKTIDSITQFAADVHTAAVRPQRGDGFYIVLVIGIGGSALGPQFVADALCSVDDAMLIRFIDNTDPDGMDRTLDELDESLEQTLSIVVSKSGSTRETRNAMLEVADRYKRAGLSFAKHAVAVTGEGSTLERTAIEQDWLRIFPMWDWVGGRTSELSAVGLVPAALQGIDIDALLKGAAACDAVTRVRTIASNPAALLALMWHHAGDGKGRRNMVVLPYRDRLCLLGRYLQQLVMESLGKQFYRSGEPAGQGLTVYGNKGSTDQHAYIQQLRDGPDDFFAVFVEVLKDRAGSSIMVEDNITTGDYLSAFLQGTRDALCERGRQSLTITLDDLDAHALGALIALFERAVGLYAELIDVNAYHQPGFEAGKLAAAAVLSLQAKALDHLAKLGGEGASPEEIATAIGASTDVETVSRVLEHAASNSSHGVERTAGANVWDNRYRKVDAGS